MSSPWEVVNNIHGVPPSPEPSSAHRPGIMGRAVLALKRRAAAPPPVVSSNAKRETITAKNEAHTSVRVQEVEFSTNKPTAPLKRDTNQPPDRGGTAQVTRGTCAVETVPPLLM